MVSAWFGKLDDKQDGTADDPRVSLIVVKPLEIRYWYQNRNAVSHLLDIAYSALSGNVATSGFLRTISADELEAERKRENA